MVWRRAESRKWRNKNVKKPLLKPRTRKDRHADRKRDGKTMWRRAFGGKRFCWTGVNKMLVAVEVLKARSGREKGRDGVAVFVVYENKSGNR